MENSVIEIIKKLFSKRIGRGAYALRFFPLGVIDFFAMGGLSNYKISLLGGIVLIFTGLYLLLLIIQRMNDIKMSRWYLPLALIPIVSAFFGLALLIRKGKSLQTMAQINEPNVMDKIPTGKIKKVYNDKEITEPIDIQALFVAIIFWGIVIVVLWKLMG